MEIACFRLRDREIAGGGYEQECLEMFDMSSHMIRPTESMCGAADVRDEEMRVNVGQ